MKKFLITFEVKLRDEELKDLQEEGYGFKEMLQGIVEDLNTSEREMYPHNPSQVELTDFKDITNITSTGALFPNRGM